MPFRSFALRGFSITIPHKQTIMKYLAECEPMAEKIGAVNTVVVGRNGKLHGSNTDYRGRVARAGRKIEFARKRAC